MPRFLHIVACILPAVLASADGYTQSFLLKTDEAGLLRSSNLNGVAVADFDLDGYLDIYFVNYNLHDFADSRTWNRLMRNNRNGTFSDVTIQAGVAAESIQGVEQHGMGYRFGAAWGDYDNDGDPDLYLTHIGPEILYRNNGDGTFTDVTVTAGVAGDPDDKTESSSAAWWDYDDDGDLDLYVSAWNGGPNRLYNNDGNGVFEDVSSASGLQNAGSTWTSVPIDVDADGLMDLYTINDFAANLIFVNHGDGTFSDETQARGLGDRGHGMGVTVEDFNNDGYFDIYLTNIYTEGLESNPLYMNDGTGVFANVSQELGVDHADWAWGTEFFDCDHDGDLDLYVANGYFTQPAFANRMFVSGLIEDGVPTFRDEAESAGVDGDSEARGVVAFDYDNDGDLDLLVANQKTPDGTDPYLYENVSATENWLKIGLRGTASNINGVGATVRVVAGQNSYYRHNDGVGFVGQSIRPVHVGVGDAERIDEIEIRWPSGLVESFLNVAANQTIELEEGQGVVTGLEVDGDSESGQDFDSRGRIFAAYPNPASDVVTFELIAPAIGSVEVFISNILGQVVTSKSIDGHAAPGRHLVRVDLADLPPGVYFYALPGQAARPLLKGF